MYRRFVACVASAALVIGTMPAPLAAQPAPAPVATPDQTQQGEQFSTAQLEALLAPVALYPDSLLTQLLMATTNPLEIVAASRWLAQGSNRELTGKALEDALRSQPWDPAVKSLVPFPQVLEMLNQQLEWTQQLGYAMQNQEAEVFDAIQRLRTRAQSAGTLQSTPQQIVRTEAAPPAPPGATDPRQQNIVIDPADPNVVYVPSYDPSQVYGVWPYADVPPVYYAPLPGYGYPSALVAGLVFGVGVVVAAALWGWARPNWGCCWGGRYWGGRYGGVNVNASRWNAISPNRPWRGGGGGVWHANNPGLRPGGGMGRPGGPVGRPVRPGGPPGVVRPGIPPGVPPGGHRPGVPGAPGLLPGGPGHRPAVPGVPGQRPGVPGQRPGLPPGPGGRPGLPGPNRPAVPPGPGAGNRPAPGPSIRPAPGPGIRPVTPQPVRPEIARPQPRPNARPAPISRPAPAPIARPAPAPRPGPAPRPAVARPAPRPAGGGPAGHGGGGGGRHR
jgi:Protein of unknown function (DUF3300)